MAKKNAFNKRLGWIELIMGPMFAGKTAELIRRMARLEYADVQYVIFKPKLDTRQNLMVASRNGTKLPSIEINQPEEILDYLMRQENKEKNISVIGIDEAQFFNSNLVEVCNILAENKYVVIVSGLDKDFKGETFGCMNDLAIAADYVTKLTAICHVCGSEAAYSLRVIDDKPARYDDDLILIGCKESYIAVCRHHHKVPGRPYRSELSKKFIEFAKA
ncbi:thymidine kinase [Ureaplasma miroungigenitalium]|uniref:Thymidine kinase n=1 Tax=Ureaplasma miroungigenitalium TaxID=1042321 RepID=A0ABT3BNA7_9BACT|nr:thymidine kinase [Ureaplasma miroungigenitalium]MCV3728715.1 thymidine kinase [Ureaplasma miroungigenitalium]MCV3734479.1 thymidine kinase [Ureaplasma miroungigenitalium]